MTATVEELSQIQTGARLSGALPYLKAEVDRMQEAIENRVFSQLSAGVLTPEAALLAWQEKIALRSMLRRIEQRVSVGVSAGERAAPALAI